MKKKAIIGIVPLYDEEKESIWMLPGYMDGIYAAGGIPVILPLHAGEEELRELDGNIDGYLLTGGHDVAPEFYGAKKSPLCGAACEDRDRLEKLLYRIAGEKDKPVLGICRGIQLLNVLHGGTLYQDLPAEFSAEKTLEHHMTPPYDRTVHEVTLEKDAPLYKLLGQEQLAVNSYHHQGVKLLGEGLSVMAVAEDGLVEGIYVPDRKFVWGIQWHPEFIYQKDEASRKIFRAFVEACA